VSLTHNIQIPTVEFVFGYMGAWNKKEKMLLSWCLLHRATQNTTAHVTLLCSRTADGQQYDIHRWNTAKVQAPELL